MSMYDTGLERGPANHQPLTPLLFLERAAAVHPERIAVVHGTIRRNYAQLRARCVQLAHALHQRGLRRGDPVAAMLPNIPEMLECHYGVPMAGCVLNAINTRLDATTIGYILDHGEAKIIIIDREFLPTLTAALAHCSNRPTIIEVNDHTAPHDASLGGLDYEALLAEGSEHFAWPLPEDEWDAIALNYTSGTTGRPKGVVYHHRGAHLLATGNVLSGDMNRHPAYLWTLPMFHCNGWCFPWTIASRAGVNVCLRKVDAQTIFDAIRTHKVTHYCGAPIVHGMLINSPPVLKEGINHRVNAMVAGAAPPAAMIEGMVKMGFDITHVYGLTETYGPAAVCVKHVDWTNLDVSERARLNARQGVRYHLQHAISLINPDNMQPVPADGETMGEIMFRGNITMKGYLKNEKATREAFAGGWFHSGDLAVMQPDGYVKIKDRSKDIIISGGENISSIEVEDVLYRHPAVLAAAVVAKPDPKWGETPCAFLELKPGMEVTPEEIVAHCKKSLAGFKVPRAIVFGELPKTSTGKIQKFELRKKADSAAAIDV